MINKLAKEVHQNARDKGFFDEERNIGEMLCLIHSEDRHKIQPFIDWLIDNNKVSKSTSLYLNMEEYLKELHKSREKVVKINSTKCSKCKKWCSGRSCSNCQQYW